MDIFNQVVDRHMTKSFKWDAVNEIFKMDDVLPMWVADMDFKAPEVVNEAIKERANHGIYGYTIIDQTVIDSVKNWVYNRYQWSIKSSWLSFSPGVITSLRTAIEVFTKQNDKILIQTPVYPPFFQIIEGLGREIIKNPLELNGDYYKINLLDFEEKLKSGVKAFILCSPHNPVGRVWTKEELNEMARLCLKYDVLILSDEIHADLVYGRKIHTPIATLSDTIAEQTITFMSPTKTFNIAGLQVSYVITPNKQYKLLLQQALEQKGHSMLNTIGVIALEAAYNYGNDWLDELIDVLSDHKDYVKNRLESETSLKVIRSEGTYLLWIDCSSLQMNSNELQTFMVKKAKVGLNPGIAYGEEGANFMRINIACPRQTLEEGVERIIKAVQNL